MRRLLAWLVALVVLTGCTGSGAKSPLDPFSRTQIEPPRTGWIMGQPAADPYYSGSRQAAVPKSGFPTAGSTTAPTTTQEAGSRFEPPGGHNLRDAWTESSGTRAPARPFGGRSAIPHRWDGDRIAIPLAARTAPDQTGRLADNRSGSGAWSVPAGGDVSTSPSTVAATSSAVATIGSAASTIDPTAPKPATSEGGSMLPCPERIVRTIGPRPSSSAGSPHGGARGATATPAGSESRPVVDIMDLPPAGSTSMSRSSPRSGGIRLVSATEKLSGSSSSGSPVGSFSATTTGEAGVDSSASRARYGYDPQYRWLRGRLEYSEIDHRWKLRYIPVEGTTDEYGGSVVLSDVSRLSGYERGEFVEVHGALGNLAEDDLGYAPEFQIHQIERLGS